MTSRRPRILIVEDDADLSAGLSDTLTDEGYDVVIAEDGQSALDFLERGVRPDVMLLDLILPRVTGWELLKYCHADDSLRDMPTIVITALAGKKRQNVIADAVFQKPFDTGRLLTAISRATSS